MTAQRKIAAPVTVWAADPSAPVSNVVDFARHAGHTRRAAPGRITRIIARGYEAAAVGLFLGTLLYAIGFVGGTLVPKSIDTASGGWPATVALCIDLQLLALVAVGLSGMARRALAAHLSPGVARSTYLLCASLALILLFAAWQPFPAVLWQISNPHLAGAVEGIALLGWLAAFYGLARLHSYSARFGIIVALWVAPTMTAGHLLFAAVAIGTIVVDIWLEQRAA
jgi:protein-S-isoprenylcysteine O-methyltransferase Ste14